MTEPTTLGEYYRLAGVLWGVSSPAAKYLQRKIDEAPNGAAEPVIPNVSQMLPLLRHINEQP